MPRHPTKLLALLFALSSVACGYDNEGKTRIDGEAPAEISFAEIDTGATMEDLDSGIGIFVEYAAGGTWTVRFACATEETKRDCIWDVYAYTPEGGRIYSYSQLGLESEDYVGVSSLGEVVLQPRTTTDLDGVQFVADEGEPMTFVISLDGEAFPNEYLFWINEGVVVNGSDTTVVEFTPTEP